LTSRESAEYARTIQFRNMAKVSTRKEIHPEDARLAAAGFDLSAPASEAIAKLSELRSLPDIAPASIARALGNIADPGAAAMLAEMEAEAAGALRREIRRALFRLHQRGIEPPQSAAAAEPSRAAAEPSNLTALFSPLDSEGEQLIWIVKSRPQGGVSLMWTIVSESHGLVVATQATMSRREFRDELRRLESRAEMKMVEGDWRLGDFLVCDAYRRTPQAERARVGDFMARRAELIPSPPPSSFEHPIYAELADEISAEPSVDLLKEPDIAKWKLPNDLIAPFVEELNRAGESTIVLNPLQQQERIAGIIERAAAQLLAGETGARIRRRFEGAAYYMLKNGQRGPAGWAAAAAARIRDDADPARVPLLLAFIRLQLGAVVAEEQQRAREEPRLIMTPAEAMRAREATRHRRR